MTSKVAMLWALTSASRIRSFNILDTRLRSKTAEKYVFKLHQICNFNNQAKKTPTTSESAVFSKGKNVCIL